VRAPVIFLDDGGVISNNREREPQWRRLLAEFLVPRLGGSLEAWAAANSEVMSWSFARGGYGGPDAYHREVAHLRDDAFQTAERAHDIAWLSNMCALVGVAAPAEAECLELARLTNEFVTHRVRAAYPDVVVAVRALHAEGVELHTASGERDFELNGYLTALEIRDCFGDRLYGVDLVRVPKVGPEFYARVFADARISPSDVLVVDDSPIAIEWARAAGASAIILDRASAAADATDTISSLAALTLAAYH
jgi:HAD superfamily hydrolase (TIGR01509 family)